MISFSIRKAIILGYLIALGIVCFFALYTYSNMQKSGKDNEVINESLRSLRAIESIFDDVQNIETGERGYVISGNESFLEPYRRGVSRITTDSLSLLTTADTKQRENDVKRLLQLVDKKVAFSESIVQLQKEQGHKAAMAKIASAEGKELMDDIRELSRKIESEERAVLEKYNSNREKNARHTTFLFFVLAGLFIVFLLSFLLLVRRDVKKRLNQELANQLVEKTVAFKDILDRISDGFIAFDSQWNYVYANGQVLKLTGKKMHELIGHNIADVFPMINETEYGKAMRRAMETQEYVFLEYHSESTGKWLENHIYPSQHGLSIHFRDITDEKNIKKELEKAESQYKDLVNAIDGIVWEADAGTFAFSFVSKQAERLLGYPVDLWLTVPDFWSKHIHPDDREWAVNFCMQSTKDKQPHEFEYRMIAADGRIVWLRDIVNLVLENGKPVSLRGLMVDITEQKKIQQAISESEEKYRTLVEQATDGIFIANSSGKFIVVNSSGCRLSQYSMEELSNMTIFDLAEPEELKANPFRFDKMKEHGSASSERKMIKKDGSLMDVEINAKFLSDGRFLAFVRDITDRKKDLAAIEKFNDRFKMISEVTHDGIWEWNIETNELWSNEVHQGLYGLTTKDPVPTVAEWQQRIHPDDRENVTAAQEIALSTDINYWESEYRFLKSDNNYITIYDRCYVIRDANGKALRLTGSMTDITERKKAEQIIYKSNERFNLIARTTNDAVWEWDFETGKGWANDAHQQLYGMKAGDPVPTNEQWVARIHPDDRQKIVDSFGAALASDVNTWVSEYRFTAAGDKSVTMYDRTYILRGKDGKPLRMMGSMMDITERKEAEREIIEAKELADKLISSLPGVFYFYDETGKFILWNRKLEEVTGYSADEIAAIHPTQLFEEGADRDYIVERIQNVFKEGSGDAEVPFIAKDGTKTPYHFKAVLIQYEGKTCLLGTGIDITERKLAEEKIRVSERKYKLLFDSNPLPMWMLSLPSYKFIDVNESALAQYGYNREDFLQLTPEQMRPQEDIEKFNASKHPAYRTTGSFHAGVWRHKRKDGSILYADILSHDIIYEDQPVRLILANNITDKYIAEEKLRASYESIRKLTDHLQNIREEERAHIAREIHDELGQQLTVLKMDVSWLNKRMQGEGESVREKLKSLTEMLDGTVKTVRRISSELRPSLLDDLGLVATIDWHSREFEKRSGIKTEFSEPETDFNLSDTQKTGIFRIFQESLTNVARHSGADKVTISLQHTDNNLTLCIEDNGKGFDKDKIKEVRTLGILGMKERTAMMGGSYEVQSIAGQGTKVIVCVPLMNQN